VYLKFRVSRDTATDYIGLFVNRLAYGMQSSKPKPNGTVPYFLARDWSTKEPKRLDVDVVRNHLTGDITINLFAINPETQRSKWVAIDADFDEAMQSLIQLQLELNQDGVESALEHSRRGGHLWVFGDTPLLAAECRMYIHDVAARIGVPVKCGSVKDGIEIFPRQDRIGRGEYGSAIRAPLGVHRRTNLRYWFSKAKQTPDAQLDYLKGLNKLTEDELKSLIQRNCLPVVDEPAIASPSNLILPPPWQIEFRILDHVRPVRKDARNWWTRCPSCAQCGRDRTGDNLSIQIKNPRFYKCWAGCAKDEIRAALGHPIRLRQAA